MAEGRPPVQPASPSPQKQEAQTAISAPLLPAATTSAAGPAGPGAQGTPTSPRWLNRQYRYLIVSPSKLVATWENNGRGWQIVTPSGLISAARNSDKLPNQGEFTLVELRLSTTEAGHRLTGLAAYRVASRWALHSLGKGDDKILEKLAAPVLLSREQKALVRDVLQGSFMREVWADSPQVAE